MPLVSGSVVLQASSRLLTLCPKRRRRSFSCNCSHRVSCNTAHAFQSAKHVALDRSACKDPVPRSIYRIRFDSIIAIPMEKQLYPIGRVLKGANGIVLGKFRSSIQRRMADLWLAHIAMGDFAASPHQPFSIFVESLHDELKIDQFINSSGSYRSVSRSTERTGMIGWSSIGSSKGKPPPAKALLSANPEPAFSLRTRCLASRQELNCPGSH